MEVPLWRRQEGTAYSVGIWTGVVTAVRGQRLDVSLIEDENNEIGQNIHRRSVRMTCWPQYGVNVTPVCTSTMEAGYIEYW